MNPTYECRLLRETVDLDYCRTCRRRSDCYEFKTNNPGFEEPKMEEQPQPQQQPVEKPKRKRRSRAEMAALRAEKAGKTVKVANPETIEQIQRDFNDTSAGQVPLIMVEEPIGSGTFVECSGATISDLIQYKIDGRKIITSLSWSVI